MMEYSIKKEVSIGFEEATQKLKEELAKEGFGILTQIDVKETLYKKIGVNFDKYIILGACNPQFAHKALLNERDIGLLLPCNGIVYEKENKIFVAMINPIVGMSFVENPSLEGIAKEVTKKLQRVIDNV